MNLTLSKCGASNLHKIWLLGCLLAAAFSLPAQQNRLAQQTPNTTIRVESPLAIVRFHVLRGNKYVTDLKPQDVALLEDGALRKTAFFEGPSTPTRSIPIDMILLFDTSGSVTYEGLLNPLVFKSSLLDNLPSVRLSVYSFDSVLRRYCRPTRDVKELADAFQRLSSFNSKPDPAVETILLKPFAHRSVLTGNSWIYEAIAATLRDATSTPGIVGRTLVVFSDGMGTTTAEPVDAANVAEELGIPIYPVLLGHRAVLQIPDRRTREYLENQMVQFGRLAESTGGRSIDPLEIDLSVIRQILEGMAVELQNEYETGFVPEHSVDQSKRHTVEIRLVGKITGTIVGGKRVVVH